MLWQTWRAIVVEDGEIFALVVRRQLDDLLPVKLNRAITDSSIGSKQLQMTLVQNNVNVLDTSVVKSKLFLKVLFHPILVRRYNFFSFWQKLCS